MDTERTTRQLRLITETVRIADALGVPLWLRGGWAMDFYLGEPTRDHTDIDWFVRQRDAEVLTHALLRSGWERLPGPPAGQQLDFTEQGEESSFALLDEDPCGHVVVAGGPWAGERWPEGMLDGTVGRIGATVCPVISPAAQIEIKRMMPVWVPGRPRRPKDAQDIRVLEAALRTAARRRPRATEHLPAASWISGRSKG
ncbi:aminoglycoside adenylyltransferase [Streptomyces sp. WA6-1-16]|uniref:nucleotidyltransferase domain-containing protein n=1 Tax=Streptomyces TaxID=1883 RepID=UPI001CE3811C|nr:aminoglycoside adenylyltransferase [Streptomyces sp. WA6-1-16]UCA53601.1 aminoglycoside adenylyltransferase [Streptomyces sp. WA6-1-16]